ncbi:rRNA methyltransferase [Intrasporangium oryzae NRRL B-24470]|uniref:rRNA methyltransferase n=2 Tax=Intrasporangium TaxID=53357 RepID=W9G3H1_9MICO|nr:rRNA methyltransferase [Intrasporangium oryzae NRRL B-24470]
MSYAAALRSALERAVRGVPERDLAAATESLVARYRSVAAASAPILASPVHVVAYAAYRMPATHAALSRVLRDVASALAGSGLEPRTQLDLGGGTGAAAWAAAGAFPSIESVTVLDQVGEALRLGRDLVAEAPTESLRTARFERARAGAWPNVSADLVTVSYVLSELDPGQQAALVADAMSRGRVVVVAEPGTPDGYARILRVRAALLAAGWRLVGPCPHELACPLGEGDWCHFAARVNRSAAHRRIKGGELSYEDEKYSWVAAVAPDATVEPDPATTSSSLSAARAAGRILRHPMKRKGFVEFQVCRPDGSAGREVVSKKAGDRYRAARDAEWGDAFPR